MATAVGANSGPNWRGNRTGRSGAGDHADAVSNTPNPATAPKAAAITIIVAPRRSTAAPAPNRGSPNPTPHGPSARAAATTTRDGAPTSRARRDPTTR